MEPIEILKYEQAKGETAFSFIAWLKKRDKVLWLPKRWMTVEERGFQEVDCTSFSIDKVLVTAGLIHSRTEAGRLVKAGAVWWRRDDGTMDWTKVTDPRQELEAGWIWIVRIGNGNHTIRQIPDPDDPNKTKPKAFAGRIELMRPAWVNIDEDGHQYRLWQDIDFWFKIWEG